MLFGKNTTPVNNGKISEYTSFVEENHLKTLEVMGKEWQYLLSGQGNYTLVFLPGIIGKKGIYFKYLESLSEHYKVIALDYPIVESLEELVEGVHKVIQYETIDKVILFGQDFGGIVAQLMAKQYPEEVDALVLMNSSTSSDQVPKKNIKGNVKTLKRFVDMTKGFSYNGFKKKLVKRIGQGIMNSGVKHPEEWASFYQDMVEGTSRGEMVSIHYCAMMYWKEHSFTKEDFEAFNGSVLIIESEVDKFHKLDEIKALKTLFENHSVLEIKGSRNMALERNRHEIIGKLIPYINGIELHGQDK
jgi:pimeloyl-ACP methyl ester carboxylesterase